MKFVRGWAFPDADQFMSREIREDGTYQVSHLDAALARVTQFGTAIDGGAHVGTWTRRLSARFQHVIAFEPSPDTFEALTVNLQAFGCANVAARQEALGASAGRVSVDLDAANAARQNTGARHVVEGTEIPVVTIDSLALADVGFIKLDIEGSEVAALAGAVETLARCRPIVLVENKWMWTRHYGLPKHAMRDRLLQSGYRLLTTAGCDQIWGAA